MEPLAGAVPAYLRDLFGTLLVALVRNELLKPVDEKWHEPTPSRERARAFEESTR
jgi:hypothetical protein